MGGITGDPTDSGQVDCCVTMQEEQKRTVYMAGGSKCWPGVSKRHISSGTLESQEKAEVYDPAGMTDSSRKPKVHGEPKIPNRCPLLLRPLKVPPTAAVHLLPAFIFAHACMYVRTQVQQPNYK